MPGFDLSALGRRRCYFMTPYLSAPAPSAAVIHRACPNRHQRSEPLPHGDDDVVATARPMTSSARQRQRSHRCSPAPNALAG
jgi:hypothetical protein